jgi:MFS family permease
VTGAASRQASIAGGAALLLSFGAYVNIQYNSFLFQEGGLSPRQIGLVVALGYLASLFSPVLAGWWSDRCGKPRAVLSTYLVAGAMALAILPRLHGFARVAPGFFLIQVALSPISPLSMALVLDRSGHGPGFLGLRAMGTLGFFLVSLWFSGGDRTGDLVSVYGTMAVLLLASLPAFLALRPRGEPRPRTELRASEVLDLLRDRRLRAVYLGCGLGSLCNALGGTILGNYITGPLGRPPRDISRAWGVATGFEMLLLFLSIPFVRRFGLKTFVLAGLGGTALRWALAAWAPDFGWLLAAQVLHGLMVAGVFTGQSLILARLLPPGKLASGTAVAALVNGGVMSVVGSALSGLIWQASGLRAVCWATSAVAAAAFLLFLRCGPSPEAPEAAPAQAGGAG